MAVKEWLVRLDQAPEWRPIRVHCIIAASLLIADSFVAMLGMTAMFTLVSVAIGVPAILINAVRRRWTRAKVRAAVIGVYVSALVAAALVLTIQNKIARARAEIVVAAGKAYHQDHGTYPDRLEALVPRYLEAVPRAKLVLFGGNFTYSALPDGKHLLMWSEVGMLRTVYEFESDSWSQVD